MCSVKLTARVIKASSAGYAAGVRIKCSVCANAEPWRAELEHFYNVTSTAGLLTST